ncbi:hypothetical protein EDB81DRAFT_283662 [Dactylonectria macrodidyma]|uniref:Uncharacterized protein n=1 Tax=Dactylonectria macrodidyma TaxID=307937 RepID=A0A9P9FPH6_9HYPO|nr:hypothetical protein EDB81DRAFT_283662 [Dactylonectria macrodidyma]
MAPAINLTEMSLFSRSMESPQNQTESYPKDDINLFTVSGSTAETVLVWGILAFCFGSLIGPVVVDMIRKHRTGELQESGRNIGSLCLLVLKAPFMLFSRKNMSAAWIWFTDLFRNAENKRRNSNKNAELSLGRQFDNDAVISRLSVKPSTIETETGTTTSDSDNTARLAHGGDNNDNVTAGQTSASLDDTSVASSAVLTQAVTVAAVGGIV